MTSRSGSLALSPLPWILVSSLALSAAIHLAVAYQHGLAGDHGRFFVAVGTAQAVLALAVARRSTRWPLWAAMGLSVLVVGTWLAARTSLFPTTTGASGTTGPLDASATALEMTTIAAVLLILVRSRAPWRSKGNVLAVLALVALPGLAIGAVAEPHAAHHEDLGEQPVQAGPAAPAPSVFGDLFDDHHAGHTDDASPSSHAH